MTIETTATDTRELIIESAVACFGVTPGFRCPMTQVKCVPRSCSGSHPLATSCKSICGRKNAGEKNNSVPRNPGGATPRIVNGW